MTANAFSSVSLDPPLILVCVNSGTQGAETIARNGVFAVNVLGAHQEPISRHFSSRERPSGRAAFAGLPHRSEVTGSPILERAAAYLDCLVRDCHEAGTTSSSSARSWPSAPIRAFARSSSTAAATRPCMRTPTRNGRWGGAQACSGLV